MILKFYFKLIILIPLRRLSLWVLTTITYATLADSYQKYIMIFLNNLFGINETLCLTLSDPGYFRRLTIRGGGGGALKAPPPPTISKTIVSIIPISYMFILPGVLGMFQLEFFKNLRF